jgi:hypothetical protein
MIKLYNYETNLQTRTFDNCNDVDCYNYSDVHDYIKFIKHGYGKVTAHASREIRLRRMSRMQGIEMIVKYISIIPDNLVEFLNWIGMTENGFNYMLDQFRNKELWKRNENWEWDFSEHYFLRFFPVKLCIFVLILWNCIANPKFPRTKMNIDSLLVKIRRETKIIFSMIHKII